MQQQQIFNPLDVQLLGEVFDDFCAKHELNDQERQHAAKFLLARYEGEETSEENLLAALEAEYTSAT